MRQLTIDWETSTSHTTGSAGEEHLLRHLYQGQTSYCALYAIAILESIDIAHVIKTAKRVTSVIRKRSRYSGRFSQIIATYKALGYTFPFSPGIDKGIRRVKNTRPANYTGKGYARLTKRKTSAEGHQVCFKDGTIYDSANYGHETAQHFIETTKYTWIIIRREK